MKDFIRRVRFNFYMWRFNNLNLRVWREWLVEKRDRLMRRRVLACQIMEFADGKHGAARQKFKIIVARGFFGWNDTGIRNIWTRACVGGAETSIYLFGDREFETFEEAVAAFDAHAADPS